MKKGLLLVLGSIMMINAHAETWCGYKDYFTSAIVLILLFSLSADTVIQMYILNS